MHMIGLADCNNFFVSCERSIDPSLEGKAVVVLSNNDGCAVARSNEAKKLGIKMGQPAFELRDLISSGKLIALSGNHLLYREISLLVHDIFRRYAPRTIDYSVDEAFLIMDGIPEDALSEIGLEIYRACRKEANIPVTLGFAHSKTLAKIATEVGKKNASPVNLLSDEVEIRNILHSLPLGDLWGVGRRLTKKLYGKGVYTIGDFADRPLIWIRKELGINGERSWRELHGESCIELSHVDRNIQDSISETRTFPTDIDDPDYLRARIAIYCAHVSKKMRAMKACCRRVSVFLQTNRFHTERGMDAPQATVQFDSPVDDAAVIASAAIHALSAIVNPAVAYKRAGVVLSDISPRIEEAGLFDSDETISRRKKSRHLMDTIDSLNSDVGTHVVKLATQLTKGHVGHNDGYSSSFGAPNPNG